VVRFWLENAQRQGAVISPEKIAHAQRCIEEMEAWPTRKLPD